MGHVKIREDILRVKSLIQEPGNIRVRSDLDELMSQLKELGHQVDEMRSRWESERTPVSTKREKQIIAILKGKSMTSSEIGRQLGVSRSRVTEYLKQLENDNIVMGKLVNRKKYYSLVEADKGGTSS